MTKPVLDPRCHPLFAGVAQVELFNEAISDELPVEQRRQAKSKLIEYVCRGPDAAYADYLLRLLDYYQEHPEEKSPITQIPRFVRPSGRKTDRQERLTIAIRFGTVDSKEYNYGHEKTNHERSFPQRRGCTPDLSGFPQFSENLATGQTDPWLTDANLVEENRLSLKNGVLELANSRDSEVRDHLQRSGTI